MDQQLRSKAQAWLAQDPDRETAATLKDLLEMASSGERSAEGELAAAFSGRLEFGTAGLRGALGPGPSRMNRVVVSQAAAGLAAYLTKKGLTGRVLIAFDARHKSDLFAKDTAEIMAGAGFETLLWERPVPTPLVPFGIRHLDCVAGVVVTASHNPPQDNGYKVYLGDGSQIVPPADAEIAAEIDAVARHPLGDIARSSTYAVGGHDVEEAYIQRVASLVDPFSPRTIRWVYTPMHGVGKRIVEALVDTAGFPPPITVSAQAEPDPDFPTVGFPNPEEPGAIDLALELAAQKNADLVIANDPDADRCAVAIPFDGRWRMLRGDELGALLGDDTLRREGHGTCACSVVSGSMLARIAEAYGQPFTRTLTGFKWIGRVPGLVFGYEEAIGYCCDPEAVPDKDGMSTLIRVLALAAGLRERRRTLADRLDELDRTYGVHATDQLSFRVEDLSIIAGAMRRLRSDPPHELAGEPVEVIDLINGTEELPGTDAIRLEGKTVTATVRPSGTEPKLKCYTEARTSRDEAAADLAGSRRRAAGVLEVLRENLHQALGL